MAFFGLLGDKNKNITNDARSRARIGRNNAGANMNRDDESIQKLLQQIAGQSDQAYADADQTVDQRFGRQIESTQDRIQANQAGAQNSIAQALMAKGGDVTGTGAALMSNMNQQGNQAQSETINQYKSMTDQLNNRDNNRGDMMIARALQGTEGSARRNQSLYGMESQFLNEADLREIQRRQANRQFGMDLLSTGIETATPFIPRPSN